MNYDFRAKRNTLYGYGIDIYTIVEVKDLLVSIKSQNNEGFILCTKKLCSGNYEKSVIKNGTLGSCLAMSITDFLNMIILAVLAIITLFISKMLFLSFAFVIIDLILIFLCRIKAIIISFHNGTVGVIPIKGSILNFIKSSEKEKIDKMIFEIGNS